MTRSLLCILLCIPFILFITASPKATDESGETPSLKESRAEVCNEPENPYSADTGHYAGYEWAEQREPASCGGNSTSFIEGCETYQQQAASYRDCVSKK